jgi:hypothetical protein
MKTIIVNGVEKEVEVSTLGYSAVVFLANKEVGQWPTVTYSTKDAKGALSSGICICITDGMIFNVANTGGA